MKDMPSENRVVVFQYNQQERDAADTISLYAKENGCVFEEMEYINGIYFMEWSGSIAPPNEICLLQHLESLHVRQTEGSLSWTGIFPMLKELDLTVSSDEFPVSWACATTIQSLILRYPMGGSVSEIPSSVQQLTELRRIKIITEENCLIKLPDWFPDFQHLETCDLRGCHLTSIPYIWAKKSKTEGWLPFRLENDGGHGVLLENVKLDEGNLYIFKQGWKMIEDEYKSRQRTVRECRVVFLGDGEAGKTSLIERILNDKFNEKQCQTDGIRISKWETMISGKRMTLRLLDFGGQEIMHSMHRCFLSNHTVYVIVCASRDDSDIDRCARRWLENVKAFASECRIILALNKVDENPTISVNERILRDNYPDLSYILKTSARQKREQGVGTLIEAIKEAVAICVQDITASEQVLGVKEELENMEADYIKAEQYREICERNRILEPEVQRDVLDLLKDLGVTYYYESDELNLRLESIRVLNPAWLTNGIYRLILRTPNGGFLSHQEIRNTLSVSWEQDTLPDKTYTREETEYILYVMRMFEISHYLGNGLEMIPMKLDKTPPSDYQQYRGTNWNHTLHLQWSAKYLPNNLVHRLMIQKADELMMNYVWRTGGVFHREKLFALLEMPDESTLDVYVTTDENDDCRPYMVEFLAKIRRILGVLHISATELICIRKAGKEGKIPYNSVIKQKRHGVTKVYVDDLDEFIPVTKLLEDTYGKNIDNKEERKGMTVINENVYGNPTYVEGDGAVIHQDMSTGISAKELAELASAFQKTEALDAQTVRKLKKTLSVIVENKKLPFGIRNNLRSTLQKLDGQPEETTWDAIRPYLSDASTLFELIQHGAGFLPFLKGILLP